MKEKSVSKEKGKEQDTRVHTHMYTHTCAHTHVHTQNPPKKSLSGFLDALPFFLPEQGNGFLRVCVLSLWDSFPITLLLSLTLTFPRLGAGKAEGVLPL